MGQLGAPVHFMSVPVDECACIRPNLFSRHRRLKERTLCSLLSPSLSLRLLSASSLELSVNHQKFTDAQLTFANCAREWLAHLGYTSGVPWILRHLLASCAALHEGIGRSFCFGVQLLSQLGCVRQVSLVVGSLVNTFVRVSCKMGEKLSGQRKFLATFNGACVCLCVPVWLAWFLSGWLAKCE